MLQIKIAHIYRQPETKMQSFEIAVTYYSEKKLIKANYTNEIRLPAMGVEQGTSGTSYKRRSNNCEQMDWEAYHQLQ